MPLTDIAVLLVTAAGTAASVGLLRRQGVRGRELLIAGWTALYGFALVAMMTAHSAEVLYHLAAGGTTFAGTPWRYDFRSYSLLLLGAVLTCNGVLALRATPALARGAPGARRSAAGNTCAVIAIAAPLIPIHTVFGVLLTVLSLVGLAVLAAARPEPLRTAAPAGTEAHA